jgi:hypothetical protein
MSYQLDFFCRRFNNDTQSFAKFQDPSSTFTWFFGNLDKYQLLCWQVKLRLLCAVSLKGIKSGGRACQRRDLSITGICLKMGVPENTLPKIADNFLGCLF